MIATGLFIIGAFVLYLLVVVRPFGILFWVGAGTVAVALIGNGIRRIAMGRWMRRFE